MIWGFMWAKIVDVACGRSLDGQKNGGIAFSALPTADVTGSGVARTHVGVFLTGAIASSPGTLATERFLAGREGCLVGRAGGDVGFAWNERSLW